MSVKNSYLIVYNALSLVLWTYVTCRTIILLPTLYPESRLPTLYTELMFPYLAGTQSLALLEISHAALGLVRASPLTTALQIGGKNLVVWTVMAKFPEVVMGDGENSSVGIWGFIGCVLAWGLSEMIRYGYFVAQLSIGNPPSWLKYLRYNAFLVLYPLGILSEASLVYLSFTQATSISSFYRTYLLLGLLAYLPSGPFLYLHMLSLRRRVMSAKSPKAH